jgi:hypothetical protein
MSFISGGYNAFWGGAPLGLIERGFTLTYFKKTREVTGGPSGDTIDDAIYTGKEVTISFTASELDLPAINNMLWRVREPLAFGDAGVIGSSEYELALPLTLITCGQALPQSITFFKTNLLPGHEINLRYATTHRKAEIVMRAYPVRLLILRNEIIPETGASFSPVEIPSSFRLVYFEAT